MEACRAHSSGVECVPEVAAATRPAVVLARRPPAERASYARAGRVEAFLPIKLAIQNNGRFGGIIPRHVAYLGNGNH